MAELHSQPNKKIGSIEYVGEDGFIVEAADPSDPDFIGGKRLFKDFDGLLRFLADHLQIYKSPGNTYGIKPPGWTQDEIDEERSKMRSELSGSNGKQPSQIRKEL